MPLNCFLPVSMLLNDKAVLITGAATRLGAEIARTLHENGANLIIHYRRSSAPAAALAERLNVIRKGSAYCLEADFDDLDATIEMTENAIALYGKLDILLNNASSFYPTEMGKISLADWDNLFNSNARAPLFVSQACATALRESQGCIINMVDIYAHLPLAKHSVYCAAKAANQMLVKSLALELAPEVRVNGIAPGAILWPSEDFDEASQAALLEKIPLKRQGNVKAITDAVLFLATNDYVNGDIIRVDGGRLLTG